MLNALEVPEVMQSLLSPARHQWTRLAWVDRHMNGKILNTWTPEHADAEYKDLLRKSYSPWLPAIANLKTQGLQVTGYSHERTWREAWESSGMAARQKMVNANVVRYGYGFVSARPAQGGGVAMRPMGARTTYVQYADPWDEYPEYALHRAAKGLWYLVDSEAWYVLRGEASGAHTVDEPVPHGLNICPVAMVQSEFVEEGFPEGDIAPLVAPFKRVVDGTFTAQMLQRYAGFPQKWASGTTLGDVRPAVDSVITTPDQEAKFGQFNQASMSDAVSMLNAHLRHLFAVASVPPYMLLGDTTNLGGDGITASESAYHNDLTDHREVMGDGYCLALKAAAAIIGDSDAANDLDAQVTWRDARTYPLAARADAFVKLRSAGMSEQESLRQTGDLTPREISDEVNRIVVAPPDTLGNALQL